MSRPPPEGRAKALAGRYWFGRLPLPARRSGGGYSCGPCRVALNHFVPDGIPGYGEQKWQEAVRRTCDGPLSIGFDGLTIDF